MNYTKKAVAAALLLLCTAAGAQYGRPLGRPVPGLSTPAPGPTPSAIAKTLGYLGDGQSVRVTAWGSVGLVAAGVATFRLSLAIPVPFQGAAVKDERQITTSTTWASTLVLTRDGNRLQGIHVATMTPGATNARTVLLDYADNVAITCAGEITGNAFSRARCDGLIVEPLPR